MFELERFPATAELPSRFIKPNAGKPLLWIHRVSGAAYLINASDETLTKVEASSGGCITADDDVITLQSDGVARYENVKPGEAVKVDEYDEYYDLDFSLQIGIMVESPRLGRRDFLTMVNKGGAKTQVLLREGEDGEVPQQ